MSDIVKADKVYDINGVQVNEYLLENHNTNHILLPSKRTSPLFGVVIHNTEVVQSDDCGRSYTAATLNGNMGTSRTHFYVTHQSAWQNLPLDSTNWTCGDFQTKGNGNWGCISLEIIMNGTIGENNVKARDNGARIAAQLLKDNKLTVDDMYTHNYFLNVRDRDPEDKTPIDYMTYCTTPGKDRNCPLYIVGDWEGFRSQVKKYLDELKNNV